MKRSPLKPGNPPERRKPLKKRNPERRAKECARAYGSPERVYYIGQFLACVVPDCYTEDPCENAHIETGGTGRKADADRIIPLCVRHHAEYHRGAESFRLRHGLDLEELAAQTEARWSLYGEDVVARAKMDGRYTRWLARGDDPLG